MNRTAQQLGNTLNPQQGPPCPYCGERSVLVDSMIVYGRSFGNIWLCNGYPACDAFVGVHKDGKYQNYPLGRLANKELREAKKEAHFHFDRIWKHGWMERKKAYHWLCQQMQLHPDDCHMGEMTVDQCLKVVRLCTDYLNEQFHNDKPY